MLIGWNTRGFGLADKIPLSQGDTLTYEYYLMADQNDLGRGNDMTMNAHEAYVGFTLAVPTSRIDEHQEVIDLLESCRKKAIDNYYAHKEQEYKKKKKNSISKRNTMGSMRSPHCSVQSVKRMAMFTSMRIFPPVHFMA